MVLESGVVKTGSPIICRYWELMAFLYRFQEKGKKKILKDLRDYIGHVQQRNNCLSLSTAMQANHLIGFFLIPVCKRHLKELLSLKAGAKLLIAS